MTSIYSFGEDSPLKFEISDKLAERYNQAAKAWFKAQQKFNQKHNRPWDPKTEPIEIDWTGKQQKAWIAFSKIFNETVKRDGPFHENDIMDDFLVKNVGAATASGVGGFDQAIGIAVTLGVLYGLLNGRKRHV